jgi:hypothetical protein
MQVVDFSFGGFGETEKVVGMRIK